MQFIPVGPLNGARLVARAWVDSGFRDELLRDGAEAIQEFQFRLRRWARKPGALYGI